VVTAATDGANRLWEGWSPLTRSVDHRYALDLDPRA
jgi:hypothetical protein